ncbi:hypothetical protein FD724_35985 (plasmid) [Nostoc sp. C057]|uniref:hypothetical protein n=1 Tax=Nostoc sp. C057 TaxID=2576903 RepID=UPI0015C3FE5D|nr:hypothetical protein [Nostoc sp. C057]QLE53310.1 hypothetical protein FD724_35985 [Nostoc sp. C057]
MKCNACDQENSVQRKTLAQNITPHKDNKSITKTALERYLTYSDRIKHCMRAITPNLLLSPPLSLNSIGQIRALPLAGIVQENG